MWHEIMHGWKGGDTGSWTLPRPPPPRKITNIYFFSKTGTDYVGWKITKLPSAQCWAVIGPLAKRLWPAFSGFFGSSLPSSTKTKQSWRTAVLEQRSHRVQVASGEGTIYMMYNSLVLWASSLQLLIFAVFFFSYGVIPLIVACTGSIGAFN